MDLPLKPTPRTLRQFSGAWLVVFLAAALRQFIHGQKIPGAVLMLIGLVGLAGLLKPPAVKFLFIGATVAAFPIGWIMTQLILAIMYYLILTPIALICRWRRRDLLQLRRQTEKSSFWNPRANPPPPENYLKQF